MVKYRALLYSVKITDESGGALNNKKHLMWWKVVWVLWCKWGKEKEKTAACEVFWKRFWLCWEEKWAWKLCWKQSKLWWIITKHMLHSRAGRASGLSYWQTLALWECLYSYRPFILLYILYLCICVYTHTFICAYMCIWDLLRYTNHFPSKLL